MALCKLLLYLFTHLQNGNKDRNHLIGLLAELSQKLDINQLAQFLVLSKCCHFEMKNRHVWGKCHLSPKTGIRGKRASNHSGCRLRHLVDDCWPAHSEHTSGLLRLGHIITGTLTLSPPPRGRSQT